MKISIPLNLHKRRVSPTIRAASGIAAAAIMAIVILLAVGSAQAARTGQGLTSHSGNSGNTGILLAAADAPQSGTAQKDTKKEAAKAPEGPPPSKFWVVNTLRHHPELAIFLTLALGYFIGAIKLGHFSLGAVTGTLLIGVLVGLLDIAISAQVKTMFFTMFLFAVGYSVGPQFVRGGRQRRRSPGDLCRGHMRDLPGLHLYRGQGCRF